MKRLMTALTLVAALAPSPAHAEFKEVKQSIFGMD